MLEGTREGMVTLDPSKNWNQGSGDSARAGRNQAKNILTLCFHLLWLKPTWEMGKEAMPGCL
jgi:hypothetical protein